MSATETNQAIRELLKAPTPDDVVGSIFAYTGDALFSSDRRMLQSFFYSLLEKNEFQDLLRPFKFSDGRDLVPFSRVLEDSLGRLQMGKLIYAKNPEYDTYGMTGEAREKMIAIANDVFSEPQREILTRAAGELRDFSESWDATTTRQGDQEGAGRAGTSA